MAKEADWRPDPIFIGNGYCKILGDHTVSLRSLTLKHWLHTELYFTYSTPRVYLFWQRSGAELCIYHVLHMVNKKKSNRHV